MTSPTTDGEGSAVSAYVLACKKHGVKRPNPRLLKYFQEKVPVARDVEELDLSDNYIGNRGILALMDVVESSLPNFRTLNLSNQKLYNTDLSEDSVKGNPTVDRVVDVMKAHPSATALDISRNPISNYAGRKLLGLAQLNNRMCRIEVDDTRIDFDLRRRIKSQCEKNTQNLWEAGGEKEAEANRACDDNDRLPDAERSFGAWEENKWMAAGPAPDLTTLGAGRGRRPTIRAEGVDPEKAKSYSAPSYDKPEEDVQMICELLHANVLFSFLGSKETRVVAMAMQRARFAKDHEVLSEGGVGDALYVIQSGTCDILKEQQKVFVKQPGTAFGELELMYSHPCAAMVKVSSAEGCDCWVLDRDTYRNLVMGSAIRRREEYAKHLEKIPFLSTLSPYEKTQVADALSDDEFQPGDTIIEYDIVGEWLFIILEGTVEVIGRRDGDPIKVCDFGEGDYFGELEFLNNHSTLADVKAVTFVRTAKLNRRHFEQCLGPVIDVLKRNMQHDKYEYYRSVLLDKGKREE